MDVLWGWWTLKTWRGGGLFRPGAVAARSGVFVLAGNESLVRVRLSFLWRHEHSNVAGRNQGLRKLAPELLGCRRTTRGRSRLQLGESGLDCVERRQFQGSGSLFRVADDTFFIDNEGRACGGGTYSNEVCQKDAVGFSDCFVQVAREGNVDAFFLRPGFLCEGAVDADSDDLCVQVGVRLQACRDVAQFFGADACKREREEKQHRVPVTEVIREFDVLKTFGCFGFECEFWSLCAG